MTVSNQTPYNVSTANGVTTSFGCDFVVLESGDLVVTVDGVVKTYTTHYTISNLGGPSNATVVFLSAPANGAVVERERVIPLTRSTDYQQSGDLLSDTLNEDMDRVWMALQGLKYAARFSPKFALSTGLSDIELPSLADGEGWAWSDDVGGLVAVPSSSSAISAAVVDAESARDAAIASAVDAAASAATLSNVANSRVFAKLSSPQSVSSATVTTVIFDDELFDGLGEYDNTTGIFTAAASGYYAVSANIRTSGATYVAGKSFVASIYVDGAISIPGSTDVTEATTTRILSSSVSAACVYVAGGGTIDVRVFANTSVYVDGFGYSTMSIKRVA